MPGRPYVLAETTWRDIRKRVPEVAILPWGATEAHNYHLPYATDNYECDHVAAEAARLAHDAGASVIALPTIPYGVQAGQLDIPLCLNMNPSTQLAVLGDLARCMASQGVRKLVVLNGHGGNDFRQMIRELQPQVKLFLCAVSWYKVVDPRGHFADLGDHAGELETSVMMRIAPALVRPLSEAGDGRERRPKLAALREGWAWAPRPWSTISADTGVGDPRAATADKGAAYLAAVIDRLGRFLIDLAAADPADLYEDSPSRPN
jgi:creatinine amidohydrolase